MANTLSLPQGMQITGAIEPGFETILTEPALELVAKLHRAFESRRRALLNARAERVLRLDAGERPDFLEETRAVREGDWKIAPLPKDLEQAAVEQVAFWYQNRDRLGLLRIWEYHGTYRQFADLDLLQSVRAVLFQYTRFEI